MKESDGIKDLQILMSGDIGNPDFFRASLRYMTAKQRRRWIMTLDGLNASQVAKEENTSVSVIAKSLHDGINSVKKNIKKLQKKFNFKTK
jgi:DNA-binding CsgD family transcriptional regulator